MSHGNENPRVALGRSTPLLAVLLLLLAVWFGWSAFSQWRQTGTGAALEQSRDQAVAEVRKVIATQTSQFGKQLEQEPVKAALANGDATAALLAVRDKWNGVEDAQLFDAVLAQAYADPASFGYSRLALLELALAEGKPVARVVRDSGGPRLGLAAPVQLQGQAAVIYIRQPLTRLTTVFDPIDSPGNAFLGLRQGNFTIVQKGDGSLGGGADALARPVEETGLRVVAELPNPVEGPMGLGMFSCLLVSLLLLATVLLLLFGRKRLSRLAALGRKQEDPALDSGLTLHEALQQEPLPVSPAAAARAARDETPAPEPGAEAVVPGIFRAYDIRGVVGTELTANVARLIGQAIGSQMQSQGLRDVVVGRDGRLSGPELADALIEGLRRSGCDVIDIGLAPTPVVYFASYHLRAGSCVAVTGSHNPPDYNGFKIVIGGETLSGDAITDLYARIQEGRLQRADTPGDLQQREVIADYVQRIADDVQLDRPLKVVADAGNGVGGAVAQQLLEAIGADVIPLYCDVDGSFPNHHPDPSDPNNLQDLVQTVKRFDADIGVAFDGDADRLGVVTKEGRIIYADRLLMLFAADVLARNPGAMVIYDVKCTGKLSDYILRNGGSPMMWKTGHSLMKAKMRETDAELAGEMSGHFFFKERWYGFDDGLYAAARLLEILAQRDEEPSEVLDELPDAISTPELKVAVAEGTQHALVALIVATAQAEDSALANARVSTIDGLRADFNDGWGLVRASNTTPVLVLRFEADNEAALERIKGVFADLLRQVLPAETELGF
ncbi:phosphomannomutase/phosphoglucomutase [Stenotrophomonas sp. SY1]|uniref:phosphomannomutase/phosphoglucomutase n=1 Tax=Stenotrophomonas sp. SY1 TaxID=477235 RepID=UPI001E3C9A57|nr:phosphomannomutase/phosphoglucomutase [Stenotrophomonas sp. SY1]MCD9088719.1 phosphomannomutase/phosphoglucomutase [Stenotrophomonas sp. SY1]